jgi:hypothetical protein
LRSISSILISVNGAGRQGHHLEVACDRLVAMGRGLIAALFFLIAVLFGTSRELRSQEANDLQGQWRITFPSRPAYNGLALIDAKYRATWDDGHGPGLRGYVAHTDSMEAEIVLTDRVGVVHTLCMIQSRDLLHCEHRYDNGTVSNTFVLTRTGPGPKTLLPIQP